MRAIGRALSVLDCFTADRRTLSLQEISTHIRLPKSTTFRLVHSLEEFGYLLRLADQRYTLSLKLRRLASVAESTIDVPKVTRPVLERLGRETGECITLHTAAGGLRSCVGMVSRAGGAMRNVPERFCNFGMSADSLVLLANMDPASSTRILPFVAASQNCSMSEMESILENVRLDGWVVSHGGEKPGVSGIAAPIGGAAAETPFCIAVTLPTARVRGYVSRLSRSLRNAAHEISVRLTGSYATFSANQPETIHDPLVRSFNGLSRSVPACGTGRPG